MNNELIIKKTDVEENLLRCCHKQIDLERFINNCGSLFNNIESKEALIKIKEYFMSQKKKIDDLKIERDSIDEKIKTNCKHEILIENNDTYSCITCYSWFYPKDVNFKHILVVVESRNIWILNEIIYSIAKNGEDIFDVFEDYVQKDNTRLNNIKVYSRKHLGENNEKKRNN